MIKGYIYLDEGIWYLGFLTGIDSEGEALFMVHSTHTTWRDAMQELIVKQIREQ